MARKDIITPKDSRSVDLSKPVEVYRNLAKNKWSIRQDGLVVGWADSLMLMDCKFIVSIAGMKKVRRRKRKFVHAYISGTIIGTGELLKIQKQEGLSDEEFWPYSSVTYDPYRNKSFVEVKSQEPVTVSDFCDLDINDSTGKVIAIFRGKPIKW